MSIEGKVVIVTGAAQGIGRQYAQSLGAAGARVVVADIVDGSETVALVEETGADVIGARLDVTDAASALAMAQVTLEAFGAIHGLVNNAGLYGGLHGGRFDTLAEAEWDATMAVNVKGIWNCCKAVAPAMREAGAGSIVNISSLAATYGMPYGLHYTTSKAAVIGLTRGLAREVGRDGIRVNAVAPGTVVTASTRQFFGHRIDKALETIKAGQTIQRNLVPSDLVGTVLWLLTDASAFVTGQTISVDGGTVLH